MSNQSEQVVSEEAVMGGVVYRGYANTGQVTVERDGAEFPLRHIVRHSPTGMTWSYAGSGPADLALSLLVDALGDHGRCRTCEGHRQVVWQGGQEVAYTAETAEAVANGELMPEPCGDCEQGIPRDLPYQQFKFDVVASLPQEAWSLNRDEVVTWYERQH